MIGPARRAAASSPRAAGEGERRAAGRRLAAAATAGLGEADDAALGLALAGGQADVAFLETVHGYGVSRGFGGLPTRVKWALLGLR